LAALAVAVVAVDQASKAWALRVLGQGEVVELLGHALRLQLSRNSGAAFSLGSGMTWVFTVLAAAVTVGVAVVARKVTSRAWALTLGLLLGGAVGNLVDRLVRQPGFGRGHVVDFIGYGDFFIGNVADIAIVGAMVLVVVGVIRGVPLSGAGEGRHAS
jgi:signal peptidase II